jgi:hypothetical protein
LQHGEPRLCAQCLRRTAQEYHGARTGLIQCGVDRRPDLADIRRHRLCAERLRQ